MKRINTKVLCTIVAFLFFNALHAQNPAIQIDLHGFDGTDMLYIADGGFADVEYVITNTGDTDLENVTVNIPELPGCDFTFATLAVGESQVYPCNSGPVFGYLMPIATVFADPVGGGAQVSASDGLEIITEPIMVAVDFTAANGSDSQVVGPGGSAFYNVTLTNVGTFEVEVTSIMSSVPSTCDMFVGPLFPGQAFTFTCQADNITAAFTHQIDVDVMPINGGIPTIFSDATEVVVGNPAIVINKSALDGTDTQIVNPGGTAYFNIEVTNTGDMDLADVQIMDLSAPACDNLLVSLAVGEPYIYTCEMNDINSDLVNTVDVVVTAPGGVTIAAVDNSNVIVSNPAIALNCSAVDGTDFQQVNPGGDALFEITVSNFGDVDLENVFVTDGTGLGCGNTIPFLTVGESFTYMCTTGNVTTDFAMIVDVVADPVGGGHPLVEFDDSQVIVSTPAIDIAKTAPDGTDLQMILPGGTATFNITITNTGDVDLVNVIVSDPVSPNCDNVIGILPVGDSQTYTCISNSMVTDFVNMATVFAEPVGGGFPVTATDDSSVTIFPDNDGDGVPDVIDNCPDTPNSDQADQDTDGFGDICDICPAVANPVQSDCDNDGIGDSCDPDYQAPLFTVDTGVKGIMFVDENDKCWIMRVGAGGVLNLIEVDCPE